MKKCFSRARLLRSAAFGVGSVVSAYQPVQAACVYNLGVRTCDTTTTTDTVYVPPSPAPTVDRTMAVPPAPAVTSASVVVSPGAVVDGYGLSLTTTGTAGPDLHFVNNGTVIYNAAPNVGLFAVNVQSLGSNVDYSGLGGVTNSVTSGGGIAVGSNGSGPGNVSIAVGPGGVNAGFNAVVAGTGGSGAVTVTTNGPVTSRNGTAILASSFSGPTVVNVINGTITGEIFASSASGTVTINVVGGDVLGRIGIGVSPMSIINISAGRSVTSVGSQTLGSVTVNNAGTLTGSGSGPTVGFQFGNKIINNLATGVINGSIALFTANSTFNNSGVWNASGANSWAGRSLLANNTGGTVNVANGTTFDGLETFTNGGRSTSADPLGLPASPPT